MVLMQDTLYLHFGKQYLKDCYIEGSVDFIFGNSTALLEHCHIHCKAEGFVTAQSRKSSQETTGYVFLRYLIGQSFYHIIFSKHIMVSDQNTLN
jgi:pectinesterase